MQNQSNKKYQSLEKLLGEQNLKWKIVCYKKYWGGIHRKQSGRYPLSILAKNDLFIEKMFIYLWMGLFQLSTPRFVDGNCANTTKLFNLKY